MKKGGPPPEKDVSKIMRPRCNERIKVRQVRVIGPDGQQLGVLNTEDALRAAQSYELDLVEIAPREIPPVCKIMDYGKYLYELSKKEKETKKKQVGAQLKEIRFTSHIGDNDYQVKLKHIIEFLDEGHRVRVSVRFRGREITHKELGERLLEKLVEDSKEYSKVELGPKLEGHFMILQLVPVRSRKKKDNEKDGEKEEKDA